MGRSGYSITSPDLPPDDKDAMNRRAVLIVETTIPNWRRVYGDTIC